MFRRNPDAIALSVIGLMALALSIPRMVIEHSRWNVTPLKMHQVLNQREDVRIQMEAQRESIHRAVEEIRKSIHE